MFLTSRWVFAMILYVLIIILLIQLKPSLMFDSYGKPKEFGIGFREGKSIFAPIVVFPILALLCYFTVSVSDLMFSRN
jgi:hypothetical protein